MKVANDVARFLVELATLAAVAYWGFHEHSSWVLKLVLGVGSPLVIAAIWGIWMAPQSRRRAPESLRVLIELAIFGGATAALIASDATVLAIVFAVVAVVNAALDHALSRPRSGGAV